MAGTFNMKLTAIEAKVDRISSLPGHVLDQILSLLSIQDAVKTSVLSRKWRYKWAKIPHLVFDRQCVSIPSQDQTLIQNKFVNFVDRVLLLHNGPIHKFTLSHEDLQGVSDIDRWILHVSRSSVKEFILHTGDRWRYKVPSCLFLCESLTHLELSNCLLRPSPAFKGLRNLKSLNLLQVKVNQDAFKYLISSCPLLERLRFNLDGFSYLEINAPNLQFLEIGGKFDDVSLKNTFQLTVISIRLYVKTKNGRNAVHRSSSRLLKFFVNLPYIQRLEGEHDFLKFLTVGRIIPSTLPKPLIHLNYLKLSIDFGDVEEILAASCILKSSPNLQQIEISARHDRQIVGGRQTTVWEDYDHWDGLFGLLRLVEIAGYGGDRSELNLINFLLSNSPVLEKMTIKPASNDGRWELLRELLSLRRASANAQILI